MEEHDCHFEAKFRFFLVLLIGLYGNKLQSTHMLQCKNQGHVLLSFVSRYFPSMLNQSFKGNIRKIYESAYLLCTLFF
jgi:hypothetical protein